MRSLEDATGDRCVDILATGGDHGWVGCRRDPEDAHGWRRLDAPRMGFASLDEAHRAAASAVGWLN